MTTHSHTNHPLYAFLRPEPVSNRQQSQSQAYERPPSTLSRSESRNERQNVVTKDLISILTTVRSHTASLDRLANTLNLITQRLDSLESCCQTGQTDICTLIESTKAETELTANATSDRINRMLEPYLSVLQTKLPPLETHVDALRSEFLSQALHPPEPTAHQTKIEQEMGRLQDSFEKHTTASTNSQSQDHERILTLEQEFKTLNNSILPLSTLSPLLQSFLQAELSRQATSREHIQTCETQHLSTSQVDRSSVAHENRETGLEEATTLDPSQIVTTPTFQSCSTGNFNQSQRVESPVKGSQPSSSVPNPLPAEIGQVHPTEELDDLNPKEAESRLPHGVMEDAVPLCPSKVAEEIPPRRPSLIDIIARKQQTMLNESKNQLEQPKSLKNASQEAQNILTQDHPNSDTNVQKRSRSRRLTGIPKRYLTRAHQASNPHLCNQPDLEILRKMSKNPEKETINPEKPDELRNPKTRKLNSTLGNKVELQLQSPSSQLRRTFSSSVNPKRHRRQLFEVEEDEQNRA